MNKPIPGDYQYRALARGPQAQRFWHSRKLELLRALALPRAGMRALDAGCGSGVVADFLARRGATVDAVDPSPEAIAFATAQFGRDRLRFHVATAEEAPFPDGTLDLIVCMEVIEHMAVARAVELLRRLGRLLAPDGLLLVTTPNYAGLWPAVEWLLDAFRLAPPLRGQQHVARFTPDRLERALAAADLAIARSGRFCGLAPFVAPFSWPLAERLDAAEWRAGQPFGNLLFALARRRP